MTSKAGRTLASWLRDLLFPSHPAEQILKRLPFYANMVSLGYFCYWWQVGEYAKYTGDLATPMDYACWIAIFSWIAAFFSWCEWKPRRYLSAEFVYLVLAIGLFLKVISDCVGTWQIGPSG